MPATPDGIDTVGRCAFWPRDAAASAQQWSCRASFLSDFIDLPTGGL